LAKVVGDRGSSAVAAPVGKLVRLDPLHVWVHSGDRAINVTQLPRLIGLQHQRHLTVLTDPTGVVAHLDLHRCARLSRW
jgi:hypothetical protein